MVEKKLRKEKSEYYSGPIFNEYKINNLKDSYYCIRDIPLNGDAPKQFIHVYHFEKGISNKKRKKNSWTPYIAKTAEKWYPHESIIEFAINRIGQILMLNMNDIMLVQANGQIRFLSKFFLEAEKEVLVHGAEIIGEYMGDLDRATTIANDRKRAREEFTFELVSDAIEKVFPKDHEKIMSSFVKMLTFDAIVGNNDRHYYNWGIIRSIDSTINFVNFAPIYDSARGLFWNYGENKIKSELRNYKCGNTTGIDRYTSQSSPRISIRDDKSINHFALIKFLCNFQDGKYNEIIHSIINSETEKKIIQLLENEIFIYFSAERSEIIKILLKKRLNTLIENLC